MTTQKYHIHSVVFKQFYSVDANISLVFYQSGGLKGKMNIIKDGSSMNFRGLYQREKDSCYTLSFYLSDRHSMETICAFFGKLYTSIGVECLHLTWFSFRDLPFPLSSYGKGGNLLLTNSKEPSGNISRMDCMDEQNFKIFTN